MKVAYYNQASLGLVGSSDQVKEGRHKDYSYQVNTSFIIKVTIGILVMAKELFDCIVTVMELFNCINATKEAFDYSSLVENEVSNLNAETNQSLVFQTVLYEEVDLHNLLLRLLHPHF